MTTPKVQVLVTTYNHQAFITQALESIVTQRTNFTFTIIVSDDGSSDDTYQLVQKFAHTHPQQVKLLPRISNHGRFHNLARLMQAATSPYLALCAGDDYWCHPDKLQRQADFLDQHPDFSICYTRYRVLSDHLGPPLPEIWRMLTQATSSRWDFLRSWPPASSSMFFRRSSFRHFPYADCQYLEDIHLAYQSLRHGRGRTLDVVGTVYRVHQHNLHASKSQLEQNLNNQPVFAELHRLFPQDPALTRRFQHLTFDLARHFYHCGDTAQAQFFLQQLVGDNPAFFLTCPYVYYALPLRFFTRQSKQSK